MRHLTVLCSALAGTALASTITPHSLPAQLFLGFGGLEARAGVADLKNGGSSATVEANASSTRSPSAVMPTSYSARTKPPVRWCVAPPWR